MRFLIGALVWIVAGSAGAWEPMPPGAHRPQDTYWTATTITDISVNEVGSGLITFADEPVQACGALRAVLRDDRFVGLRTPQQLSLALFARANSATVYVVIEVLNPNGLCEVKTIRTCFDVRNCAPPVAGVVLAPVP